MKFEDILKSIGDENRFQIWLILLLLLPTSFFNAFHDSIIQMATPDHWCRVPELEALPQELQHRLIRPYDNASSKESGCLRYDVDYTNIRSVDDFDRYMSARNITDKEAIPTVQCSDGWLYDQSLYTETAVTWYDFVCDRDYYANSILSLSLIGLAFMTPIISNLSDRIGRRKTLMIVCILAEIACINPLILKNLPSFVASRFLSGGIINVFYQLPFVMIQELVSQKYRTRASALSAIFYSLGSCFVPIIAKVTRNWVNFTVFQFLVTLPFILAYKWIPESPFWLISTKKYDEAYEQLERIAKVNGRPVPKTLMKDIKSIEEKSPDSDQVDSFSELFMRPGLRYKTLIITFVFSACLIGYGGISYNTINLEAKNQLYNFLFLSAVDIPSLLLFWYLLNSRFGRRWSNVFGLALCGGALVFPAFVPSSHTVNTVCTIIGKFGIAGTYMVIYQHASELFPTTLRNQGIGLCATVSSLVGISVPQLVYIAKYGAWVPLAIIGSICLTAAFLSSFLPETLNEYLPQRSADSALFGQGKLYFSLASPPQTQTPAPVLGPIPIIKIELDPLPPQITNNNNNISESNGKH